MAAESPGLPVWTAGVWGAIWEEDVWDSDPVGVENPFGDVRYLGFGARIRRGAAWFVWPLLLLVG